MKRPNYTRHRIAALLRFGINVKGRVWAARGERRRYAYTQTSVVPEKRLGCRRADPLLYRPGDRPAPYL